MRGWIAYLVVGVASCGAASCGEAGTVTPPATTPAPPMAQASPRVVSYAVRNGTLLDSCTEIRTRRDEASARATFDRFSKLPPESTVTTAAADCGATDATELASCEVVDRDNDETVSWRYFLFETALAGEGAMRQCMRNRGRWKSVSRDSDAYRDAQLQASERRPDLALQSGIPECDELYGRMMRCGESVAQREELRTSFQQSFGQILKEATDPAPLVAMCQAALQMLDTQIGCGALR